jgi:nitroreductase
MSDTDMRHAALRATLAPSVHNTQPWRYVITRGSLELYADETRRLRVLDPRGRQLLISCGCALFNARVALAAAGYDAKVERLPDATRPELLARVTLPAEAAGWVPIGDLDAAIEQRRTNRRRFFDQGCRPSLSTSWSRPRTPRVPTSSRSPGPNTGWPRRA